jgi:chromosome segregation ATPase
MFCTCGLDPFVFGTCPKHYLLVKSAPSVNDVILGARKKTEKEVHQVAQMSPRKEYPHETIVKQQKQIDRKEAVIVKQQDEIQQAKRKYHDDMLKMQKENYILKDRLDVTERALTQRTNDNAELRKQNQLLENRISNYEAEDNTILVNHRRLESANHHLCTVNDDLRVQLSGLALRFDVAGKQVENLIEDNKVLRSAIATIGSIVKVAEQL